MVTHTQYDVSIRKSQKQTRSWLMPRHVDVVIPRSATEARCDVGASHSRDGAPSADWSTLCCSQAPPATATRDVQSALPRHQAGESTLWRESNPHTVTGEGTTAAPPGSRVGKHARKTELLRETKNLEYFLFWRIHLFLCECFNLEGCAPDYGFMFELDWEDNVWFSLEKKDFYFIPIF